MTPVTPTHVTGVTLTGREQESNGKGTGRDPPDASTWIDTPTGGGWVIAPSWSPPEAAIVHLAMHTGITREFATDPARVSAFVMHYAEAPQRDPAWSSRYRRWVHRDWIDRSTDTSRTDGMPDETRSNRFLDILDEPPRGG